MNNKISRLFLLTLCTLALLSACKQTAEVTAGQLSTKVADKTAPAACAEYSMQLDILLCENEDLSGLVSSLASLNAKAGVTYSADELDKLKADQADWDKVNLACMDSIDALECVRVNYQSRISALQIGTASTQISSSANYLCDADKHDYITAVFYNRAELPTVVLTRVSDSVDDQILAAIVPSGSGAKYQGKDVMFWSKEDKAQVLWGDDSLECKELAANSGGI
jgi:membrane-bound inhibitor of C-type lysozyme